MEMFRSFSPQSQIYSRLITLRPRVAIIDRFCTELSRLLITSKQQSTVKFN